MQPNSLRSDFSGTPSLFQRLQEYWSDWRNRRLMDRGFQRWAGRFFLTRRVSQAKASEVFDIVAGFVYSQILFACVQAKVFDLLADGPKTKFWLAEKIGLDLAATEVLLDAAQSLNLLERRSGERYALGMLGAPLVGNVPVLAMVEHHRALYADLKDPLALLKARSFDTELARYWPYTPVADVKPVTDAKPADELQQQVAAYSTLMAASQPFVADEVLSAVGFKDTRCVLDVGGGEGKFLLRLAKAVPHLKMTLFDLPAVAQRGAQAFEAAGVSHRATAVGGSFLEDALPLGFDTITLLRVIHDHDDPQAMILLKAIRAALPAGGRLILAEPMAETAGAQTMGHAYFGFYLWAMGRGRSRSAQRITQMLMQAGFTQVIELPSQIPLQARLLQAS